MSDPWNWDVDRVVQELCTTNRTWHPHSPAMSIVSDPQSLEAILREQEVTGSVLLGEINMSILKDDFGIKALGRRSFIMSAIDQFRARSLKYNSYTAERSLDITSSEVGRSLQNVLRQFQQTSQMRPSSLLNKFPNNTLRSSQDFELYTTIGPQPYQSENTTRLLIGQPKEDELRTSDSEVTQKRTKLTPVSLPQNIPSNDIGEHQQNISLNNLPENTPPPTAPIILPEETIIGEFSEIKGKKRKRIAPTRFSSIGPITLQEAPSQGFVPNESKSSVEVTDQGPEVPALELMHTPGVVFRDSNGRKKMIPILQFDNSLKSDEVEEMISVGDESLSSSVLELNRQQNQIPNLPKISPSKSLHSDVFLGKKKMNVDSLFYEGVSIGSRISDKDESTDFYYGPKALAKGRRLYVHNCLKYFLRSQRQDIVINGKFYSLKVPYSRKLVTKFKDQSFTLYHATTDGKITAHREVNIKASTQFFQSKGNEHLAAFNPKNRNILEQIGSGGDWDCSTLEKYRYLDGGDTLLPLYGESDEDNEFDEATWKEIESEYGERERPQLKLKKSPISEKEVFEAIDSGIADIVNSWKIKNVHKRELKAWRLWRQSRRLQNKREQIAAAKIDLNHIQEYMTKMRDEILADIWTSTLQVRRQVKSMEASVISREELKWKISILKQKRQPEKPSPIQSTRKRKKETLATDEDLEGDPVTQSESEYSSDDDMGDFIDDDEIMPDEPHLHEVNFADSENEDAILSDCSSLDDSIPLLQLRGARNDRQTKSAQESSADPLDNKKNHTLANIRISNQVDDCNIISSPVSASKFNLNNQALGSSVVPESNECQLIDLTLNLSDNSEPNHPENPPAPPKLPKISFIDITMSSEDEDPSKVNLKSVTSADSSKQVISKTANSNDESKYHGFQKNHSSDAKSPLCYGAFLSPSEIPPLSRPSAIARYSYEVWQKLGDKQKLLSKLFYEMLPSTCSEIIEVITSSSAEKLLAEIKKKLNVISLANSDFLQSKANERIRILFRIYCIFEIFTDCKYYSFKLKLDEKRLGRLCQIKQRDFHIFCQTCIRIARFIKQDAQLRQVSRYRALSKVISDDDSYQDGGPQSSRASSRIRLGNTSEGELTIHDRSKAKRRKPVYENKEARDMREQNLNRLAQQNERRKKLHAALVKSNDDQAIVRSQLIINDAASEGQKFIYVNDHIAKRIKKHQVDGVRFLWNQIVTITDEQSMQGCLLAHTMGLGKTMQTITLLVAIAEAANSDDPSVSSQIPESLRVSRTLVLCPPSLVNNWMDELLVWVPDNLLGELRKVDSSIKYLPQRLETIFDWYHEGGVLVIGYEMFRDLVNYKSKNISDTEHEQVSRLLLEGPNIIIADEAHRMKNKKAAITIAACKFRSKSRIALTGSPLANNIEEYHTMIDWVAPNYLGPIVEFRAKYVEPIQAGNYQNSTAYERRKSLKMLGVLSADLAPKVHRADMSVMKNDLPPKKEFIITVPLTDIQKEAYSIFVKSMLEGNSYTATKSGDVAPTAVWHWLAVLSLLCNHPECFRQKLLKRKEEARDQTSPPVDATDNEESAVDLNTPLWKAGVSQELVDAESKMFEAKKSLDSVQMSNKVLLLCQILDACKSIGDKALVFSQSIPTLDFLEDVFKRKNRNYARLDGSTAISKRQGQTKDFNNGNTDVYLISTTAGGLGLNLQSANRVIIFDFKFNPIMEEQAIGRAYRIGQRKPTFIYRFIAGGTFEDSIHNKTVFKTQLASRVVDKKNPIAWANKKTSEFLFEPKEVPQKDLSEFEGMDPGVLDRLLQNQKRKDQRGIPRTICSIVQTDTFAVDDDDKLTPDEEKEVQSELEKTRLFRANPQAFHLQQIAEHQSFRHQFLHQSSASTVGGPTINFGTQTPATNKNSSGNISATQPSTSETNTIIPTTEYQKLLVTSEDKTLTPKSILAPPPFIHEINALNSKGGVETSATGVPTDPHYPSHNSTNTNVSKNIVSKAQSPVAGANTKIADLKSKVSGSTASQNSQPEESGVVPTSSSSNKVITQKNVNSEGAQAAPDVEDVLPEASGEIQSNDNSEKQASEELDAKASRKPKKEWDMTKRYRESRASNVPDYGPIAAPNPSKSTTELDISKLQSSKKLAKLPPVAPLNYVHSEKSVYTPNSTLKTGQREKENIKSRESSSHIQRPVPREYITSSSRQKEPDKNQVSKTKTKPSLTRATSALPRRPPPPPPPPYRWSSPPSYRRPSSPLYRRSIPLPHIPTGPRSSTSRQPPPWEEDDRTRICRRESYRPLPRSSQRYSPYY